MFQPLTSHPYAMHHLAGGRDYKVGPVLRVRTELSLSGSVCVKDDERFFGGEGGCLGCNCVCVTVEPVSSLYTPFQRPISHPALKMRSTIYKDDVSHNSLIVCGLN